MSINFDIICRLCMKQSSVMFSLFEKSCILREKIMSFMPVLKIFAGDNLPTQVCHECADQINSFDSFKLMCENTNHILNEHLQKQRSENVPGKKGSNWEDSSGVSFSYDQLDEKYKNVYKNERKIENRCFSDIEKESFEEPNYELIKLEPIVEISELCESKFIDEPVTEISSVSKISIKSEGTKVSCNICNKFIVKRRLKEHLRRHLGGRPFKCDQCDKAFTERRGLKNHSLVHSGVKVHMCDICGKRFKFLGHLKAHHLTHTGQKLHVCTVCGKGFSQIGNFKKHQLLHTGERPFACDICGKNYSQKSTLQIHLAVHTGQRQHVCEICGKGFLMKVHLTNHLVVHSGEKKFSCDVCGLTYTQQSSLKKHKAKHLKS